MLLALVTILQFELRDSFLKNSMGASLAATQLLTSVERSEKDHVMNRNHNGRELALVVENLASFGGSAHAAPEALLTQANSYLQMVAPKTGAKKTTFDELESAGSALSQLVQKYLVGLKQNAQDDATSAAMKAIELALLALLFLQGGFLLITARNQARANHGASGQGVGLRSGASRGHRIQDQGHQPVQDDGLTRYADGMGSHNDLLRLIATANAPIIGIDASFCVNEWNQKAVSLTGFSRDEVMGRPLVDEFIEPRAQSSVREVLQEGLQGSPHDNYQFTLMTKDKRPLQILLNATPRYDATARVVGVIGIGQDVSKELAQQADLLRLITTANAPIIGIDASFCVNEWNEKAESLTGFAREEAMGRPLIDEFIEPQAQESVKNVMKSALLGTPTDNYQFVLMTKTKRPLQMLLNATPRFDAMSNVVGVIGIGQDVSKELAQQADLLRLIATANAPIIGIDAHGCVNEWNEKAVSLTEFSREEVMGHPLVEEFIEPQTQDSVREVLENALKGESTESYQFTLMTKSRRPLQILLNATPRFAAHRKGVVGVIGIGQDISKQIADHELLLESQKRSGQIWDMLGQGVAIVHMNLLEHVDEAKMLISASPGMTDMLGFVPTKPREFYSKEDFLCLPGKLRNIRQQDTGFRFTETVVLENVGRTQQTMMKISDEMVACVYTSLEEALQETRVRESQADIQYLQMLENKAAELRNERVLVEEVREGETASETLERLRQYDETSTAALVELAVHEKRSLLGFADGHTGNGFGSPSSFPLAAAVSSPWSEKRDAILTSILHAVTERLRVTNEASYLRIRAEDMRHALDTAVLRKTRFDNHEIRGLMQNLLAFITLSETLTEDERHDMGAIIDSVVDVMSNSLLVQSMAAGAYVVTLAAHDVNHLVRQIKKRFQVLCEAKLRPCEFNVNISANAVQWIMIDSESILRCCMNYVTNAIKFSKSMTIHLEVGFLGAKDGRQQFKFQVMDDGDGIDEKEVDDVWLPFRQARSGRLMGKEGTGLGLPITKGTVEAHPGGQVGCVSKKGHGSCFWFVIDAVEAPPEEIEALLAEEAAERPLVGLLVDDDSIIHKTMSNIGLRGVQWHMVATFADALAAVEAREVEFQVALVDYHLDAGNKGNALIRMLLKACPSLVCIGGTSDPSELTDFEYRAAGAVDVIQKPYKAAQLRKVLKQHLPDSELLLADEPSVSTRLLIVDDSPIVLRMMPAVFKRENPNAATLCDICESGEKALELLNTGRRFDAALVDYNMGDTNLSGADTVHMLKKIDPSMICFGVTGNGDERDVLKLFKEAGAYKVFCKPFARRSARSIMSSVRKSRISEESKTRSIELIKAGGTSDESGQRDLDGNSSSQPPPADDEDSDEDSLPDVVDIYTRSSSYSLPNGKLNFERVRDELADLCVLT